MMKKNRFIRGLYFLFKSYFGYKGGMFNNVTLTPPFHLGNPKNIIIKEHVGIGPNCYITATNAKFIIEGNCSIAEGLTVHTGNHVRVIGKYITEINESNKPKGFDKDVVVKKDVWIGCNVTILSGTTIERGATIAAGAVVNKNIPPYCIAGGVPAKMIKFYLTIDEILQHESILYPKKDRYTREQLEEIFNKYSKK